MTPYGARTPGTERTETEGAHSVTMRSALPFLLSAASVVAVFLSMSSPDLHGQILWGSVGLSAYLASLFGLLFSGSNSFGLFEGKLGAWALAYAIVAFGAATVTLAQPQYGALSVIDRSNVPMALILIGLSFTVWSVGYLLGRARIAQAPFRWVKSVVTSGRSDAVRDLWMLVGIFALGVSASFLTVLLGGNFGYLGDSLSVSVDTVSWYSQPLEVLSGLKFVALFGLSVRVFVYRADRFAKVLLPLMVFAFFFGLLTGTKESFVTTVVSVGVPYLLGNSKHRVLSIAGGLFVFVFVVTPFVTGLRFDVRKNSSALDVRSALSVGADKISAADSYRGRANGKSSVESTVERVRIIDNLALIIGKTPEQISYRSLGEVAAAPITGFVPRLLWPNKPVRLSGLEFYKTYYKGLSISSAAITVQGSLYLYGGPLVLLGGMFLVGLALRALDEALNAKESLSGALLVVIIFPVVVKQEMDVASFLASIAVFVVTWFLGVRFIFLPVGGQQRGSGLSTKNSLGSTVSGGSL